MLRGRNRQLFQSNHLSEEMLLIFSHFYLFKFMAGYFLERESKSNQGMM